MIRRIHAAIDPDLIVGAWGEGEFLAILRVDAATAISISREVAATLSTAYSFEEDGQLCAADFKVKAGAIDRGSNEFDFQDKLAGLRLGPQPGVRAVSASFARISARSNPRRSRILCNPPGRPPAPRRERRSN